MQSRKRVRWAGERAIAARLPNEPALDGGGDPPDARRARRAAAANATAETIDDTKVRVTYELRKSYTYAGME